MLHNLGHNSSDSEAEYWQHVPEFEIESLLAALTEIESTYCGSESGYTSVATAGASGSFDIGTSQSLSAHSVETNRQEYKEKKKPFYCITRGRRIGVFDNWSVSKFVY